MGQNVFSTVLILKLLGKAARGRRRDAIIVTLQTFNQLVTLYHARKYIIYNYNHVDMISNIGTTLYQPTHIKPYGNMIKYL